MTRQKSHQPKGRFYSFRADIDVQNLIESKLLEGDKSNFFNECIRERFQKRRNPKEAAREEQVKIVRLRRELKGRLEKLEKIKQKWGLDLSKEAEMDLELEASDILEVDELLDST